MNHYLVNGVKKEIQNFEANESFKDFINKLRKQLITETTIIASIKVNGSEINEADEAIMGNTPLSKLGKVEITTIHPREMADETLQMMIGFTENLEFMSKHTAQLIMNGGGGQNEFSMVAEGIGTLAEGLVRVKSALRISGVQEIDALENDLLSIARDLSDSAQRGEIQYVIDLLNQHLPKNLQAWREDGIPKLIRSRDS